MNTPLAKMLETKRPLILSGAMGTELERRGINIGLPLWSAHALTTSPDVVRQIHCDYIDAGADIIVTNTFRTNRRVFATARLPDRSLELTAGAIELARQARRNFPQREILIAGCVAPVEDCYAPDRVPSDAELEHEHAEFTERLASGGVDFILVETMTTIREAFAACKAALATGKEVIVSFTCNENGTLYGGEPLADAITAVRELKPTLFSLNCISPRFLTSLIHQLKVSLNEQATRATHPTPFAIYGNVGKPNIRDGMLVRDVDEEEYVSFAQHWRVLGAAIVGGCCGTTPEYIRRIARAFRAAT